MERSWSEAALAAFDAYPWRSEDERRRAREEAELVAFGAAVEVSDLPIAVRRFAGRARAAAQRFVWKGEAWADISAEFEKAVFGQALEKSRGRYAAAARLLKTTPRVVAYAAHKHGLAAKGVLKDDFNKKQKQSKERK